MLLDWEIATRVRVWVDSSAAVGVANRRGSGKMRHVRLGHLWIQQKTEDGELSVRKISGKENPADVLTKHLNGQRIREIVEMLGGEYRQGRAAIAPKLERLESRLLRWDG